MDYTESTSAIFNLLPYAQYEQKYWAGELTAGEAWIPTDLVSAIPTKNTALRQALYSVNKNASSYSPMSSGEVVYVKPRTYEVSISVNRISQTFSASNVYTIIAEVGSTPYTVRVIDLYTEANAVLKWRGGNSLYNSDNVMSLQANRTYVITINNGLASYEEFY